MLRKEGWTRESHFNFPNIWLLCDDSATNEPKNVAISSFAQRFHVPKA
jgi:hypothetical protein